MARDGPENEQTRNAMARRDLTNLVASLFDELFEWHNEVLSRICSQFYLIRVQKAECRVSPAGKHSHPAGGSKYPHPNPLPKGEGMVARRLGGSLALPGEDAALITPRLAYGG